ncbi:MAG TPA: hypothetical protein VHY79_20100 [Rhizomicrobium sp.]|jgi:hypothetical protein|nr:hypothetical protein [Rhizomicrobium sp.]
MSSAHSKNPHQIPDTDPVRIPPPRRRRKSLRHHFCDGIEAAVKGEPGAVAATKPRNMMGLMVRNLVCRAGEGRCDAVRLVVFFLDEAERRRVAAEQAAMGDSQGNSAPPSPREPEFDWDDNGAWESSARGASDEDQRREDEAKEAKAEALRDELKGMIERRVEAERINTERRVRLEMEREGRGAIAGTPAAPFSGNYPGAPAATSVSGNYPGARGDAISGNFPAASRAAPISGNSAAPRDPHAGQIRIGGRLVEG